MCSCCTALVRSSAIRDTVTEKNPMKRFVPHLRDSISLRLALSVCLLLFAAGMRPSLAAEPVATATPAAITDDGDGDKDPLIGVNRAIYRFNDRFDRWLLKPVAQGYDRIMPNAVQDAISRFFANLQGPTVIINDALQGKFKQSAADTGRFVVNSTIGLLGLFDVAQHMGLAPHDEDFGQTLGVWGVGSGPYFVWPILGPKDARDSLGFVVNVLTNPVTYLRKPAARWSLWAVGLIDARANLLGASSILEQAAGDDEYLFLREAYRQRREHQIYDGKPPRPQFFDDDAIVLPPAEKP